MVTKLRPPAVASLVVPFVVAVVGSGIGPVAAAVAAGFDTVFVAVVGSEIGLVAADSV